MARSPAPPGAGWELGHLPGCDLPPQAMAELITLGTTSPWVDGGPAACSASPLQLLGVPAPAALPAPGLCRSTGVVSPPLQCVLTGRWINDLGSNMTIGPLNGKGEFAGSYHTAVTATTNEIQVSPLQGSQQRTNQRSQPTFGFTVNWSFSGASPFPASLQCPQSSPALHCDVPRPPLLSL